MPLPLLLCTRATSVAEQALAARLGLALEVVPLFVPESLARAAREPFLPMANAANAWAFTSPYAVAAYDELRQGGWHPVPPYVYAVGEATASALHALGLSPRQPAEATAHALTQLIAANPQVERVLHLCGAERRADLRHGLARKGLPLTELVVYRMVPTGARLQWARGYAGALLFSPAGVQALWQHPGRPAHLPLFAVSDTAAAAALALGAENVHIAEQPTFSALLARAARVLGASAPQG